MAYGDRRITQALKQSSHCTHIGLTLCIILNLSITSLSIWTIFLILSFITFCCPYLPYSVFSSSHLKSSLLHLHPLLVALQTQLSIDAQDEDDHLPPGWTDSPCGLLPLHLRHLLHLSPGPWHDSPGHTAGTPCLQTGVSGGWWSQSRQSLHTPPQRIIQGPILEVGNDRILNFDVVCLCNWSSKESSVCISAKLLFCVCLCNFSCFNLLINVCVCFPISGVWWRRVVPGVCHTHVSPLSLVPVMLLSSLASMRMLVLLLKVHVDTESYVKG